jgi:hypothetical protein
MDGESSSGDDDDALDEGGQHVPGAEVYEIETHSTDVVNEEEYFSSNISARTAWTFQDWTAACEALAQHEVNETCLDSELFRLLQAFVNIFTFEDKTDDTGVLARVTALYHNHADTKARFQQYQDTLIQVRLAMTNRELLCPTTVRGRKLLADFTRVAFGMKMILETIVTCRLLRHSDDQAMRKSLESMIPMTFFQERDEAKLKKHHQLINHYYHEAFRQKLQKIEGDLYEPIYREGVFVHAYARRCEIKDFVWTSLHPQANNENWIQCLLERPSTPQQCINVLTHAKSEYLPTLVRNSNIHAFLNGLFVLPLNAFYWFAKEAGRRWVGNLKGNLCAVLFHEQLFHEDEMEHEMRGGVDGGYSYKRIQLPVVHQILSTQKFSLEERFWIVAMFGRLLFPVNTYDSWGVMPFLLGLAGTGKGTFFEMVMGLFDQRDVGIVNNTLQRTFPLDGLEHKKVCFGMDIDEHLQLDQATWQSMVVGEEVAIIRKNKTPLIQRWNSQLAMAGNRLLPYEDTGGNVVRRLCIIEFVEMVPKCDPNLKKKGKGQMDRLLKVFVSAYLDKAAEHGKNGLKEVLPVKFIQSERKALLELNALSAFLNEFCDVDMQRTNTFVQPFAAFNREYRDYCKRNSIAPKTLNYTYTSPVFAKFQIKTVEVPVLGHDPHGQTHKYLTGLTLKAHLITNTTDAQTT